MAQAEYDVREIIPEQLIELYQKDHVVNNAFRLCFSKHLKREETLIEVIKLIAKYSDELTKSLMEVYANQPKSFIFSKP